MRKKTRPQRVEKHQPHYEHPSFGLITCHREQGAHGVTLAGSDITHRHTIAIEIYHADRVEYNAGISRFRQNDPVTRLEMSEAQWATFVSSMNNGNGTPCTLRLYRKGDYYHVPHLEYESKHEMTMREMDEFATEILSDLDKATAKLEELTQNAGAVKKGDLKDLSHHLRMAIQDIAKNLPYHVNTHREIMEKNVEEAKANVEGYIADKVMKFGQEQMNLLTGKKDSEE